MRARLCAVLLVAAFGCSEPVEVGFNAARGGGGAGGSPAEGGRSGAPVNVGGVACEQVACRGKIYDCGDCDDNDRDGKSDAADPECLGPCDDNESTLSRDESGTGGGSCRQDCYFDRNSGVGNDCSWSHTCDELSVAPDFPPSGAAACAYNEAMTVSGQTCASLRMTQSDGCRGTCLPLAPNGCDCFGCCELPAESETFVWVGSGLRCTPVKSCFNPCDPCEICVGKPAPSPSCGTLPEPECDGGLPHCGATASCGSGAYCITGCCVASPH